MNPNTPLPPAATGAVAGGVQGPPKIEIDKVIKVTAYWRADGWVAVTVYYQACPFGEEEDLEVWERRCMQVRRYYIPAQRAPIRHEPKSYRQWRSRKYIELWLRALTEYVDDVRKIIEFAAAHAPEEVADALRRYEVRAVVVPPGLITWLGIKVGSKVIPIGPPPEPVYTFMAAIDPPHTAWHDVAEKEYVRTIAWTAMWKEAVEKVAGCRVEYRQGGAADVKCGNDVLTAPAVLPLSGELEAAYKLTEKIAGALEEP